MASGLLYVQLFTDTAARRMEGCLTNGVQINEATGTIYPDVRAQFRTTTRKDETSYAVYVQYRGIAQIDAKMLLILSGSREAQSTEFGDHEWFVWPVVETNHPGFKWVERAAFVGEGRWVVEGDGKVAVEVEVYQVGPSEGSDAGR